MRFRKTKPTGTLGHKSKTVMLLERRKKVMELYRQRYTQSEIADLLGIDRRSVGYDIKCMMEMLENEGIEDAAIVRVRELMDLDVLERGAQQRLEKMKGSPHQGSRWAEIILSCKERRAKLLGLDAEQKFSIKSVTTVLSKDQRDAIFYAALGGTVPVENQLPDGQKSIDYQPMEKPPLIEKALDEKDARQADIPTDIPPEEKAREVFDVSYSIMDTD